MKIKKSIAVWREKITHPVKTAKKKKRHEVYWRILGALGVLLFIIFVWQASIPVPTTGDWQPELARLSSAQVKGDVVTVKNVRDFRYRGSENDQDLAINYYDKTYNLNKLTKVWYVVEPFSGFGVAAHTFLSFEFSDGNYLSISIEARKLKGQDYNLFWGLFHTYPLMYIAADERDAVLVRTNIRKSEVYLYPVKLSKPENARLLLTDMLNTMNDLLVHPAWYNTLWANCTSLIAYHVDRVSPGRLSLLSWQLALTGYADELALKAGLIDTNLPLAQARQKYYVTKKAQTVGAVPNFSALIRQFDK